LDPTNRPARNETSPGPLPMSRTCMPSRKPASRKTSAVRSPKNCACSSKRCSSALEWPSTYSGCEEELIGATNLKSIREPIGQSEVRLLESRIPLQAAVGASNNRALTRPPLQLISSNYEPFNRLILD